MCLLLQHAVNVFTSVQDGVDDKMRYEKQESF